MLAKWPSLATNASINTATSAPTPTFSPSLDHWPVKPALIGFAWKIPPESAITCAWARARSESWALTVNGGRPLSARIWLRATTNAASSSADAATGSDPGHSSDATAAIVATAMVMSRARWWSRRLSGARCMTGFSSADAADP